MTAILFVLLLGTATNAYNGGAKTPEDYLQSAKQQITHPKIEAADYSKLNQ